jgi:hypothetical protein
MTRWLLPSALAVALAGCTKNSVPVVTPGDNGIVSAGSVWAGNGLWSQTGGTVMDQGKPPVRFGMAKPEAGPRRFTFFLIFHPRLEGTPDSAPSAAIAPKMDNPDQPSRKVHLTDRLSLSGNKLDLALDLETDAEGKAIVSEKLTLNRQPVDPAKGRVFLVDLTAKPATWKQIDAKLPDDPPETVGAPAVRELVERTLDDLGKQSEAVREFLR